MSDDHLNEELVNLLHTESNFRVYKFAIEMSVFVILFSSALTDGVTYNLLLNRACTIDLQYNETKCALLHSINKTGEAKELENKVQAETTFLVMSLAIISSLMPAILSGFLGSWSDKHGRKPLVVWPIVGQVITSVLVVIFSALPSLSSWWFVLCALPFALLGGSSTMGLGYNLLVTDVTNENNRSFRLALLQGYGFIGVLIGTVSSSYVYEAVGYVQVFTFSAIIYLVILMYIIFCLGETLRNATKGTIRSIFDCGLLRDMIKACFRKRPLSISVILTLLISAYGITMFCVNGVGNIDYLFTRQKFQWLLKEYSIFSAVNTILIIFGLFFGMAFFQSVCKMSDGVLLILSYMSSISDAVVRCLSQKSWHMYLAGTMSMLGGLSPPLIRSQITKVVPTAEVGKMYSLVTCVEALAPVFSPILFNTVYFSTLTTFPAAVYAVSGGLFTVCFACVIVAELLFYGVSRNQDLNLIINS